MNLDNYKLNKLNKITYLDNACMGVVDSEILDKIKKSIDQLKNIDISPTEITYNLSNENQKKARNKAAQLMGVSKDSIALMENTTQAMSLITEIIDFTAEDNVLLFDFEFLGNKLLWKKRGQRNNFKVKIIPSDNGVNEIKKIKKYIDKNTKAIILSSIQETNGFRIDIEKLSKIAKSNDSYLVIDGIQEAGVMDIRRYKNKVDFYCTGGHKWLRNPFGMGFLYIDSELVKKLNPPTYGYFNAKEPSVGWSNYLSNPKADNLQNLQMVETARKFEIGGTGNPTGAIGLFLNLEKILKEGILNIENEVFKLTDHLISGLDELNLKISGSKEKKHRSAIVSFTFENNYKKEKEFQEYCLKNNVYISHRYNSGIGGLRVSPNYYNNREDIDYFLDILEVFLKNKMK